MYKRLEEYVKSKYANENLRIWERGETDISCYLRFTVNNELYIIDAIRGGNHADIFKKEGSVKL